MSIPHRVVGGSEEMLKLVCSSNAWINRINLAFNLASPMPTPSIVFWWTDAIHRRSQYSLQLQFVKSLFH